MQKDTADQTSNGRLNKRSRRKLYLIAVLLLLTLGSYATLNYLAPKLPNRPAGLTARMKWYVQSGQMQADRRSLAELRQFLFGTESAIAPAIDTNLPLAGNASPSSPKS